jgi:hypothetical protein
MANLKINAKLWDDLAPDQQSSVVAHLKAHNMLKDDETIVGDAATPALNPDTVLFSMKKSDLDDAFSPTGGGPFTELCKIGCDGVAAAAIAALTLEGPALAAAIAGIAAARDICRNNC